jgi:hypothetical protein
LCKKKQTVNGRFYEDAIKRLIARVHRVKPELQESVSWYILHDNEEQNSLGEVSEFLPKRRISCFPIHLTPLIYVRIKNCNERDQILGWFIDPTDCEERTEGAVGSVFSGIRFIA